MTDPVASASASASVASVAPPKKHSESLPPFVKPPLFFHQGNPYTVSAILPLQAFDYSQG
jgi:hypothetical protein